MHSARIAISPPQRALAGGPLILCSSREMPEGLLDAPLVKYECAGSHASVQGEQDEGRGAAIVRADSPGPREKSSPAIQLRTPCDMISRRHLPVGCRAEAGREAFHAGPATPHPA